MNFKDFFFKTIKEMAKPNDEIMSSDWYHGTNAASAKQIVADGFLRPSQITTNAKMAPMKGKVYLTRDLKNAIGYAFFRSGTHLTYPREGANHNAPCYLIVIDGKELQDVDPDEDAIADIIPTYVADNNGGKHPFPWLRRLAELKAPKSLDKYDRHHDYAYGTHLGKILIKYLTDDQKYALINHHKNLSHTGQIKVKEVWEIPMQYREQFQTNPASFKEVSKRIL